MEWICLGFVAAGVLVAVAGAVKSIKSGFKSLDAAILCLEGAVIVNIATLLSFLSSILDLGI